MRINISTLDAFLALAISALSWLLGGFDLLVQSLLLLVFLDIFAGIVHAVYDRRLNSTKLRQGLVRKVGYFVLVALAATVDRVVFQQSPASRTLVCSFLIVSEGLSIIEHLAAMGVPVPEPLRTRLEKLREMAGKDVREEPE